jgi:outer membrane protein OmpA-like peptidoglycan-associated protein
VLAADGLALGGGPLSRIEFLGANTVVPTEAEAVLTKIAALVANTDRRLQLNAYAGGTPETVSAARRLSLSRALAVRSFLIEAGVRSTRIDVRALGLADDDGPPERVDILLLGL